MLDVRRSLPGFQTHSEAVTIPLCIPFSNFIFNIKNLYIYFSFVSKVPIVSLKDLIFIRFAVKNKQNISLDFLMAGSQNAAWKNF